MIEARNLSRRYGDFHAVRGVSFTVNDGEIVGMLGPNGAGKTTTLRMITGYLPPTAGTLTVGGKDLFTEPVAMRREIGYLPENVALYTEMRVAEYLWYRAMLEGMSRSEARARIPEVVGDCILDDVENQIIGTLSKGYRQRVGLAAAILHNPQVLVLDEPTVGLDPKQIIAIRDLIRELGREQTLLISSHILPEVELLCDRVIIIDRGRIVAEGTPQDLRASWLGNSVVSVELKVDAADVVEVLSAVDGVKEVRRTADRAYELDCQPQHDPREEVFRAAVERGWVLLELRERTASLEDIFVRLTTQEPSQIMAEGAPSAFEGGESS
jgi:ABC-2 type transport system ATP-binding protein